MKNALWFLTELFLANGLRFFTYECEIGCEIHGRDPTIYNEYIFVKLSHIKLLDLIISDLNLEKIKSSESNKD